MEKQKRLMRQRKKRRRISLVVSDNTRAFAHYVDVTASVTETDYSPMPYDCYAKNL